MIVAPVTPVVVNEKSLNGVLVFTPDTDSGNVTVKSTLAALVGDAEVRMIEDTVGEVASIIHVKETGVASKFPAASLARINKVCDPSVRLMI